MIEGSDELLRKLKMLSRTGGRRVAVAAMSATVGKMRRAVASDCPGTIGKEIGARVIRGNGPLVRGEVGLGVGGAERKVARPHGRFVTLGTKNMEGQGFVKRSLQSNLSSGYEAGRVAAEAKLEQILQ